MAKSRQHFGSVIQRPGRPGYYLRIRYRGQQRVRYSSRTKTVAHAHLAQVQVTFERDKDLDAALDAVLGPTKQPVARFTSAAPTFRDVAERYMEVGAKQKRGSTRREDRTRLDVILQADWTTNPIDSITKGDVALWLDEIGQSRNGGKGLASSTLNRYRSLISVVFNFAIERELVTTNPVSGLRRGAEGKREEFLTAEELLALLEYCRPELRLLFLVAATTGLRQGVLRQLRWADLDLEAGTMLVKASYAKSKKPQLIPLVPDVADGLRQLQADTKIRHFRGDDAVFRTKTGRPWSRSWLCHLVRKVIDSCPGIPEEKRPKISFHTMRHSFASLLMLDGLHPRKLQEALAHSDPKLTSRYSHLDQESMLEIQQRIAQLLGPKGPDRIREGYLRGYQASVGG